MSFPLLRILGDGKMNEYVEEANEVQIRAD